MALQDALLQDRISGTDPSAMEQAAVDAGLDADAQLVARYRSLKAQEKAIADAIKKMQEEIKPRLEAGELLRLPGAGYLALQPGSKTTYDVKGMMMNGLFTPKDVEPWTKVSNSASIVFKAEDPK